MTYERREGEPATRGLTGLRKVYKRGYVVEDSLDRKDDDVEAVGQSQDKRFDIGDADDEDNEFDAVEDEQTTMRDSEGTIVRKETPPVYARALPERVDHFAVPSEDNPWA